MLFISIWYTGTSVFFLNQITMNIQMRVASRDLDFFQNGENLFQTKFLQDVKERSDFRIRNSFFSFEKSDRQAIVYIKLFVNKAKGASFFSKNEAQSVREEINKILQNETKQLGFGPISIIENSYSYYFNNAFVGLFKIFIYSILFSFLCIFFIRKLF